MKKTIICISTIILLAVYSCRDNSNPRSQNDNTEVTSQSDASADTSGNDINGGRQGYDTSGYYDNDDNNRDK